MNRHILLVVGLLCVNCGSSTVLFGAEPPELYVIETRLSAVAKDGKTFVVTRPTMMTVKDQEGSLNVSNKEALPGAKLAPKDHIHGFSLRARIYDGEHGKLMVDAEFTRAHRLETPAGSSRFVTNQFRIVEPVKLGEIISVPLDPDDTRAAKPMLEIRVTQGKQDKSLPPW